MKRVEVDVVSVVLILVACAVFALSGIALYKTLSDAAEAHRALCTLRDDLEARLADSEEYLTLTPAERVEKYGKQLGSIPEATIQNSVATRRETIASLAFLRCE